MKVKFWIDREPGYLTKVAEGDVNVANLRAAYEEGRLISLDDLPNVEPGRLYRVVSDLKPGIDRGIDYEIELMTAR